MSISTRHVEDLLRLLCPDDGHDRCTIARWVAPETSKARAVFRLLDAACIPEVEALALGKVSLGGGRPWWPSSRTA